MAKKEQRTDIETLLGERARVEAWLEQVAAKAATMPAHVVERVYRDYDQRLSKVVADLLARADELRTETAAIEERLGIVAGELTAKRDARAEDELRALVGEYDEAAWRTKAAEHDGGIGKLEAESAERQAEHARIRGLLAEATRAPRASASMPVEASTSSVEPASTAVAEVPPEVPSEAPPDVPPPVASEVLTEVAPVAVPEPAGEVAPQVSPAQPAEARASSPSVVQPDAVPQPPGIPAQAPTAKRPSPFDEIGFLRTVVGRVTPFPTSDAPAMPPKPAQSPRVSEQIAVPPPEPRRSAERTSIPGFEAPPIPDVPAAAPARASAPAMPVFTDDPPPAQVETVGGGKTATNADDVSRSLKCQECGWMNYPTEWYCEKCGGELAAF